MGNTKYLMVLAVAAVGLFAMPSMLATFAGTHSVQGNYDSVSGGTTSGKALNCLECHQYIGNEADVNNNTKTVYNFHSAAASNKNYTTYMAYYGDDYSTAPASSTWGVNAVFGGPWFTARRNNSAATVKPDDILALATASGTVGTTNVAAGEWYAVYRNSSSIANPVKATDDISGAYDAAPGGADWRACLLCHRSAFFFGGTHTRITVRSCTNSYCHGDGSGGVYTNGSRLSDLPEYNLPGAGGRKAGFVGNALNSSADAHNTWFKKSQEQKTNKYYNYEEDPNNPTPVSDDYYTCLGCHSHANMKLTVKRPDTLEVFTDKLTQGQPFTNTINVTSYNESFSYKAGSAWGQQSP